MTTTLIKKKPNTWETRINRFDEGISDNMRDGNSFALIKDMKLSKKTAISHRAWRDWTNSSENISRFLYGKDAGGSSYRLYGFGDDGSSKPRIFHSSIGGTSWSTLVSGTTGARASNVFFKYKDILYNWENGTILAETNLVGTPTYSTFKTISYTNVAQPVHHEGDDIAYFFSDNKVHKLDDTSWTANIQTIPNNLKIVGGASYGNYLAIVCSAIKKGEVNSVMFLWDRNTADTLFSAKIDLGFGEVKVVEQSELGGIYIVQDATRNTSLFGDTDAVQLKYYDGNLLERNILLSGNGDYLNDLQITSIVGQEEKGVLYFGASILTSKEGTTSYGIIKVWIENGVLKWAVDREVSGSINGIFNIEGSWYIAHSGTTTQSQGNDATLAGTMETNIFRGGNRNKLLGITVFTSPDTNSFTLKYRKDNETSWTQIFTRTSGNKIKHSAVNIESSGANLPEYNEIQFQLLSTSSVITELAFTSEEIDNDIY